MHFGWMDGCKGGNSTSENSLSVLSQNQGGRTPKVKNFLEVLQVTGPMNKTLRTYMCA